MKKDRFGSASFRLKAGLRTFRFWRWLIRFIGVIVPQRFRARFRQEWEAELEYRETLLARWDRLDWRNKLELLRRSLGAFWDALLLQPIRLEDEMFQDLRYGARMMLKSKMLTMVAVLSLALGIGANTAIFSLINALMLRMLPVKNAEELALFSVAGPQAPEGASYNCNYPLYEMFRDRNQTLTGVITGANVGRARLLVNEPRAVAESVQQQRVSGNFFSVLGVNAVVGRALTEADDNQANGQPGAVISYEYWRRRFGLDPQVVGRQVTVNNTALTIVGVAPPGFFGFVVGSKPELWWPIKAVSDQGLRLESFNWIRVIGRLRPGVSMSQAQAEMETIFQQQINDVAAAQSADWTPTQRRNHFERHIRLEFEGAGYTTLRRQFRQPLFILMAAVGLTLLIACINVANLLLARAATRRKEIAVRLALGAGRFRLLRQLLTESVLLAGLGGALGVVLAYWGKDLLLALQPWGGGELALDLKLDFRVLSFTTIISLLTGLLFGLTPALRATRLDLTPTLKDTARNSSGDARSSLSKALVVAQVALSLVLLIGAGLFTRTLRNLQSLETGFNHENLVTFGLNPRLNNYPNAQIAQLFHRLLERLETIPGVRAVTLSQYPILAGSRNDAPIFVQGQASQANDGSNALVNDVAANFLDTLQIPILRGRGLTSQDDERAPRVAVVNQAFARKYFGAEDPLGKRFGLDGPKNSGQFEIVGLAQDAKYFQMRGAMPPTVYLPYFQEPASDASFAVRTTGEPTAMIASIRQAVREIDGSLPISDFKTVRQQVESGWAQERLFATLSSFFGLLAVMLAAIGLYGVMAYSVARRRNEIGIRMALGAQRRDVIRLVLRESLLLVALGAGIGLATALATTRLISAQLFGLAPTDPLTITAATLLLLAVATLAGYLPARKAAQTDPMLALRDE